MIRILLIVSTILFHQCIVFADSAIPTPRDEESHQAQQFLSYEQAKRYVRANLSAEEVDTSESSFIRSAEFFSTGSSGYLILNLNGKDYIFTGVPRETWESFKSSRSRGKYFNQVIKGRFRLEINDK